MVVVREPGKDKPATNAKVKNTPKEKGEKVAKDTGKKSPLTKKEQKEQDAMKKRDAEKKAEEKRKTEANAKDAEKRQKAAEAKQLKSEKSTYSKLLDTVKDLKQMTDTRYWQKYYGGIKDEITQHGKDVLDAEGNKDVVLHQQGVKILRKKIAQIKFPVVELNTYRKDHPLFAQDVKENVTWNESTGTVEIEPIK